MTPQYAFRAQKSSGIADGPSFSSDAHPAVNVTDSRSFAYSPDGQWFAHATPNGVDIAPSAAGSSSSSRTLPATAVHALKFSPLSRTLFTFERPGKSDGTEVHKNVRAWDVESGEEVGGWHQRTQDDWEPLVTADESYRISHTGTDILLFSPSLSPRPSIRLKGDGSPIRGIFLSHPRALPEGSSNAKPIKPHGEPGVAVWFGEKKGAPGGVRLFPLSQLVGDAAATTGANGSNGPNGTNGDAGEGAGASSSPTVNREMPMSLARKAFYKADKLNVKWNNAGTMALFLAHTDVDSTGKSYYGETNLYLVSLDGFYDGLVDLDKEGPVYDFNWSPTSREFAVCYGYMPARTQLFDIKNKPVHSFGSAARNYIRYQPQGKLLLSAGFGNLAGGLDVWDISTRNKVAEFTASNSSQCEWSPCGRYILTATLSPRLRVDNGVKIWWCGGQLLHVHPVDSLYQAAWKPALIDQTEGFPAVLPAAPERNESVALYGPKKEDSNGADGAAAPKPTGAYRPPGARGAPAPDSYKRDADDHSSPASGTSTPTPMFRGGKPPGRYVPGAPPPGAPQPATPKEDKKKRVRSKRPLKDAAAGAEGGEDVSGEAADGVANLQVGEEKGVVDEAVQKKIRALNKKLKAIDDLRERMNKGETLEKTQMQKIETEGSLKAEIAALGGEA